MYVCKRYLLLPLLLFCNYLAAQNYQAINGSPYAGSLAVVNNPASIVHVPYAWDITPFSVQLKHTTNAFKIEKYSLLSSAANAETVMQNGTKKRFAFVNQDIRLFNTRVSLNSKAAIAFGANIRNYGAAESSVSNWQDTVFSVRDFMKINNDNQPLSGKATAAVWGELYVTYAQTVIDDGDRLLNGGITVKITRALAGGYGITGGLRQAPFTIAGQTGYALTVGNLQYGYSSNIDIIDSNNTTWVNTKRFLKRTTTGVSVDIGIEYILLSNEDNEDASDYAYKTKIGLAVMDFGSNKYQYGRRSRIATAGKPGISDTLIENKFSTVVGVDDFNDSLATITGSIARVNGEFHIYQPTRLMINIDQHIFNNVFVNAELTIPLMPVFAKKSLYISDMNLLAITPRWELKSMGVYLPVLFNSKQQLWVGGAIKAGPVLFGTHNLANLFSKNKTQTGGLYLAFTIRPGKKYDRQAHYPKGKGSAKERRGLECPRF